MVLALAGDSTTTTLVMCTLFVVTNSDFDAHPVYRRRARIGDKNPFRQQGKFLILCNHLCDGVVLFIKNNTLDDVKKNRFGTLQIFNVPILEKLMTRGCRCDVLTDLRVRVPKALLRQCPRGYLQP